MHLLGTCVLVTGLAAFVIIGFLRVAQDLLSRSIFDAPSLPKEDRAVEVSENDDLEQPTGHHQVLEEVDRLVLVGKVAVE